MSAVRTQSLDSLLDQAGLLVAGDQGVPPIAVTGVAMDSRALLPGDLFVALRGAGSHGLRFVKQAEAGGATAVLHDGLGVLPDDARIPLIEVPGLAERSGHLASLVYAQPSSRIDVVGVTGTNGKTSSVHFVAQALTAIGHRVGTQGTLGSGLYGDLKSAERTTPDAAQTQRWLASMVAAGADCVAMEVSSHALVQGRVDGLQFRMALFTNLSRDHLDYHRDMEDYFQAKARLFARPALDLAVINTDDPAGRRLLAMSNAARKLSYGKLAGADVRATQASLNSHGMSFVLHYQDQTRRIELPLLGQFNLHNALGVAAGLLGLGHSMDVVARGLAALRPVPGRMQWIDAGPRGAVVVDYAHTPEALEQALSALREHCSGTLRVVFGCGGDRDQGKRAPMGRIAESLADQVIVSDDNPRSESAQAVAAQILSGCERPTDVRVIHNRAEAIAAGLETAVNGDLLLIAGKGHERTQESAGLKRVFDDADVARRWLEHNRC